MNKLKDAESDYKGLVQKAVPDQQNVDDEAIYYREYPDTRMKREIQVDYPIEKPTPKQKTQIVYDLGSPQMNTQGINASIPVTTDKYTYTITSVLSSMSQNDSPPISPTSSGKRPISSYKVITPNSNVKLGKKKLI